MLAQAHLGQIPSPGQSAPRRVTGVTKHLMAGLRGAESCAIVASVIHTAKLNEIEPLAHRRDLLKRIVSTRTKASELGSILQVRRRIRGRFY
jgi:hypothetical protein